MDRAYIEQRQVLERYLRGTLTPEELGDFEVYMLDHPDIVDDLEYARGLSDAMPAAKDELFGATPARRRAHVLLEPRYAMAATALLALTSVSTAYLFLRNAALTDEIEQLGLPSLVSNEVWLENMRGGEAPIVQKAPTEALLLRIPIDPRSKGPYEVRIRGDNGFSWTQSRVFADDDSLRIVARDLPLGTYELTATSDAPRATVAYRFRLVVTD